MQKQTTAAHLFWPDQLEQKKITFHDLENKQSKN